MARRKLSMQGRIVAAGLSVGVAAGLAGFMAAGDHSAGATQPSSSVGVGTSDSPSSATPTPYRDNGDDSGGTTNVSPQYSPQPQTRTGGS